jgi:hypothetical protein
VHTGDIEQGPNITKKKNQADEQPIFGVSDEERKPAKAELDISLINSRREHSSSVKKLKILFLFQRDITTENSA